MNFTPITAGAHPHSFRADTGWRWWHRAAVVPACPHLKEFLRDTVQPDPIQRDPSQPDC